MGVLWLIQCCLWELKSAKALRNPSRSTGGSKGWMRASWCQDSHVGQRLFESCPHIPPTGVRVPVAGVYVSWTAENPSWSRQLRGANTSHAPEREYFQSWECLKQGVLLSQGCYNKVPQTYKVLSSTVSQQ